MSRGSAPSSSPEARRDAPWTVGARALWLGAASITLVIGASAAWPGQIDDAYISLVFSHELVENGRLAWSDGRVVEGYSNPLWVLLGGLAPLLWIDGGLLFQCMALSCSLVTLFVLTPRGEQARSSAAYLLPVLLAASDPMGWWAGNAMETPAFGLCLALGWRALLASDQASRGIALLCVAALLRPEGHLHLLVALPLIGLSLTRQSLRTVAVCLAGLTAYHVARMAHFGELLPLPAMIKGLDGQSLSKGLAQVGMDLLPWLGLLALAASTSSVDSRARRLALLPLLVQAAVLARAGGDWMGHGRLLLPGIIASLAVWSTRSGRWPSHWTVVLLAPLALLPALITSPLGDPTRLVMRDLNGLRGAILHPRLDLDTTQMIDLQFVIPRIPAGEMVYSGDVGMLGHVSDLSVRDMVGLTDEDIARSRAYGDEDALARTLARLSGGPDSALCMRMVGWGQPSAPDLPEAQAIAYPAGYDLRDRWSSIRWSCREELTFDPELSERRWRGLADRFPSHPWIRWNHALALADNGDVETAAAVLKAMNGWGRWAPWKGHELSALLFTRSTGLLTIEDGAWVVLEAGASVTSRALAIQDLTSFEVEVTGEPVRLFVSVSGPECERTFEHQAPVGQSAVPLVATWCGPTGALHRVEVVNLGESVARMRQVKL